MSRRLHEHHRTLREAEVWLEDVPRHGSFRVALVWPNLYFVGMSNLGFQAVYRLLNGIPDVVCERAFLPDDEHKAELERTGSPLVSFETGTPLRDFDAIAFSVSFENDYLHVLQVLRLAGIPLRARDRGPRDPLVILGGAALMLNPEPLAPFADLVAVGEGEPMVPRMMEALLGATRAAARASTCCSRRTASTCRPATSRATTRTARSPATAGPRASCASAAGRARWASRSRSC